MSPKFELHDELNHQPSNAVLRLRYRRRTVEPVETVTSPMVCNTVSSHDTPHPAAGVTAKTFVKFRQSNPFWQPIMSGTGVLQESSGGVGPAKHTGTATRTAYRNKTQNFILMVKPRKAGLESPAPFSG
jgi:hypothetical protein